jgi:hypothetical protein
MRFFIKHNSENKTWMVMSNRGVAKVVKVFSTKADAYNYVRIIQENKSDPNLYGNYLSQLKRTIPKTLVSRYGRHVAN